MKINFKKILNELSYRVSTGIPDLTNEQHLMKLWDILKEEKWPMDARVELLKNLDEAKKVKRYPGTTWTTASGHAGKRADGKTQYGMKSKDVAQAYVAGKDVDKDTDPKDIEKATDDKDDVGDVKDIDTLEQEVFKEPLEEPTDDDFKDKNEEHSVKDPINLEEKLKEIGVDINKVPKKYLKVLERMMNTNFETDSQGKVIKPISELGHFIADGGAGEIRSQAGEILTMVGSSIQDPEKREKFFQSVEDHIKKQTTPPNAPTQEELDSVDSVEKLKALQEKYPSVRLDTPKNKRDAKQGKLKKQNFYKNNNVLVQSSWLDSARQNNKAIDDYLKTEMGEGYEVVASAWDVNEEAEALGLDMSKKGKSTDSYIKVRDKDGNEKIVQISLKKDGKIRLTNSSPSKTFGTKELTDSEKQKFRENAKDVGIEDTDGDGEVSIDDIDEAKWAQRQNKKYLDFFNKPDKKKKLIELIKSGKLKTNLKKLGIDPNSPNFEERLDEVLSGKGGARDRNKLLLDACEMVDGGDEVIEDIKQSTDKIIKNIAKAMEVDPIKEKMLNNIQESLPLRDIVEGKEVMMVGDISMDKKTMEKLFGTSDFSKVKQNLKVDLDENPPVVKYIGENGGKVIHIATIGIREDGKNYGSSMKFEMTLSKDFEDKAKNAHQEVHN